MHVACRLSPKWFILSFVLLTGALCQTALSQDVKLSEAILERAPHPTNARLKDFGWLWPVLTQYLESPPIKSLTVTLRKQPADQPGATDFRKFEFVRSTTTRDVDLMHRVRDAIAAASVRLPQKKKDDCDWMPFGELEINLGDTTVRILMGDGFTERDISCIKTDQVFFSKPLASLVDRVLRKEFDTGLTTEQFERLSGESARRKERQAYADDEFGKHDLFSNERKTSKELPTSERLLTAETDFKEFPAPVLPAQWEHFVLADDESVVSVTLKFKSGGGFFGETTPGEWLNTTAVDAITLKRAARGLRGLQIRMPEEGDQFAGIGPSGIIEFRTSKRRTLRLELIPPMTIDGVANPKSFCWSWTLAKVINDIILRETGMGLTEKEFRRLGGDPD